MSTPTPSEDKKSLIEFPTHFPIKVMGKNVPEFSQVICDLLLSMSPEFDVAVLTCAPAAKAIT